MTQPYNGRFVIKPYNGRFVIKPIGKEPFSEHERETEIAAIQSRIEREIDAALPLTPQPYGFETSHLVSAEKAIDNRRINREDKGEIYLDLDPMASNLPARQRR